MVIGNNAVSKESFYSFENGELFCSLADKCTKNFLQSAVFCSVSQLLIFFSLCMNVNEDGENI